MEKTLLLLAGLFLCAGWSLQAQTQTVNTPSGMGYSIHTEANFDRVTVYSVDSSGGSVQLFNLPEPPGIYLMKIVAGDYQTEWKIIKR